MVKYFRLNILKNRKHFKLLKLYQKLKLNKKSQNLKDNTAKKLQPLSSSLLKGIEPKLNDPISDHFSTFLLLPDLFTLLYSSIVFKWINSDRLLLIVDNSKVGYQLELYLHNFLFNSIFLDNQMPVNTNNHFYNQFIKGKYNIIITNSDYGINSPKFPEELIDDCPIPITIIYFNCTSMKLIENHAFHPNTRSIYHFVVKDNKNQFIETYSTIDQRIQFNDFVFDFEQMCHLRYRCEDIYNGIKKKDIEKEKIRKINVELLHSKKMEDYFAKNPNEKANVIAAIEKNSIKNIRPSSSYLPSYLIHNDTNAIADAIRNTYPTGRRNRRRNKKGKMEEYFEALDKGDGSHQVVNF